MKSLLCFYGSWCTPCHILAPRLDIALANFSNIKLFRINIDNERENIVKYNIKSVPTLILKDEKGNIVKRYSGLMSVEEIIKFLT